MDVPSHLDLSQYGVPESEEGSNKEANYRLDGVIIHEGNLRSGHYYAAVRSSDKRWAVYNDHMVSFADEEFILQVASGLKPISSLVERYGRFGSEVKVSATGYILFYSRL